MQRQLATIQEIEFLERIPGKDNIYLAKVMGWQTIVRKNEFPIDGAKRRCVFFEVDSVLPEDQEWAQFLKDKKYRIKTMKLCGVISQGVALPVDILKTAIIARDLNGDLFPSDIEIGKDVTKMLGVTKYEPPIDNWLPGGVSTKREQAFPEFLIPKTDELRIQSSLYMLNDLYGKPYYITVKLDGTSATYIKTRSNNLVCSRNFVIEYDPNTVYGEMVDKYNIFNIPEDYAIQAEIVGPKIQQNPLGLKERDMFVFNVYNLETKRYLDYHAAKLLCKSFGLNFVPVEEEGESFSYGLKDLLSKAEGKYQNGKPREGIVIRPQTETMNSKYGRLSFKAINNTYLLKVEK